ncbi:MAG TPA: ATP-binding protein, partial [Candidatus Megaira endosymbiont of Nemacystus decipiens]|nr:ATP-binding protein [Candidatus Megaera endosymbiont of Nemacystus decipiens]
IAIVAIFLLLNLSVGLYYGRGVTSIADYALGGRNFSTAALVSTVVATTVTGSLFTIGISRTYSRGLYDLIPTCGVAISLFLITYFVIPRMKSFLGSISVADAMGKRYGKIVRVVIAICAVISNLGIIAVQYKVFGSVINYFSGTDTISAIIVTGVVITIYSTFGGIRSVTFTDVMQFMIFGTVIPLIGIIIWKVTLGVESFSYYNALQNDNFNLSKVLDYNDKNFLPMMLLFFYFAIPSPDPAKFQRIVMGRNLKQVQDAFFISSIVLLLIIVAVAWIGFLLFALDPTLNSNELIPYIIDNYSYTGLKGFIIAGIMAMVMSSADSFINVASVLAVHDVYKPIKSDLNNELLFTRIAAVVIGISPIFLALSNKDLLQIILSVNAFYLPIVVVPLLLTLLGFKTTTKTIISGMAASFLTVIVWKTVGAELDPIAFAMLVNFLVMMLVHYVGMQKGGWVKVEMEEEEEEEKIPGVLDSIYKSIRHFSFIGFIHKNSPRDETIYSFFGIFCFISTLSTIYLTQQEMLGKQGDLVTHLYSGMLVISTFFGLHMMWSDRIRNPIFISIMWHVAIIYNITFCTSFFLFMSGFHNIQILVFTLSLMVLFSLCRWKTALTSILLGVGSSVLVYEHVVGEIPFSKFTDNYNVIVYIALIAAASLFAFIKPKEEYVDKTERKITTLEHKVNELGFDIFKKDKEIISLNDLVALHKSKINDLNASIDVKSQQLDSIKDEVSSREYKILNLTDEIASRKRQLKELSKSSNINNNTLEKMRRGISEREESLLAMQNSLKASKDKIEVLKYEVSNSKIVIGELDRKIIEKQNNIANLKDDIVKHEEKIERLNNEISRRDGAIKNLHEEVDFFKQRNQNHEKEIERLGATSQRILNNVTHELRLPVGNVMNFAEMLSSKINSFDKKQLKMISDEVFENSNRLSTMIMNMLDLATMDVKKIELNKKIMNIGELVKERVTRCQKIYLDDKPIEIRMSIQEGVLIPIDVHYIQQTIDNIIINAIKFSKEGTIRVSVLAKKKAVVIKVDDQGVGIPPAELYDIFMPFKMGSNTESKAEGRGVGLALCKSAVEAHGGTITVKSLGVGASFTIELPFEQGD